MVEVLVVIVPLIAFVTGGIFGYRRGGTRQWRWLCAGIGGALAAAGVCYVLSLSKTGGYLAGIVGAVMTIVALIMAGGILVGALARGLHELIKPDAPRPTDLGPADAWVVGLLAAAMMAVSLAE